MCICRHGAMQTLNTDNASYFISAEMSQLTEKEGIRHITSTPYHPEGNGQAERMVKEVKSALKTMVQRHGRDWPLHLQAAMRQLRSCNNASTRVSPHFALYGRLPRAAVPQVLQQELSAVQPGGAQRQQQQERIEAQMNNNLKDARTKQKVQYDKRHEKVQWRVGDIVTKKTTRQNEGDRRALNQSTRENLRSSK